MPTQRRFARAVLAFLALPGTVAFAVPLVLLRPDEPARPFAIEGLVAVVLGCFVLAWCTRDFYVLGKGTLAPWSPPQQLVTAGLYRYSRNPMYIGVVLILAGWALGFRSFPLAVYALGVMVVFHVRVVRFEEPWLRRTHGTAWDHYARLVPRWSGLSRLFRVQAAR